MIWLFLACGDKDEAPVDPPAVEDSAIEDSDPPEDTGDTGEPPEPPMCSERESTVAEAGASIRVEVGEEVMLDGSASVADAFAWEQRDGPETLALETDGAEVRFTPMTEGIYELRLTATGASTDKDDVLVAVGMDAPPTAVLVDAESAWGAAVTLDASDSCVIPRGCSADLAGLPRSWR
ncbi:MAG: hypothetical protein GY913_06245 [Proteobacteria bacterium]|nr:hypothetical protein [Pseudomonadota bacterium]MCP4916507.1 hypothetical protein [Pseudomonadota bacterium]